MSIKDWICEQAGGCRNANETIGYVSLFACMGFIFHWIMTGGHWDWFDFIGHEYGIIVTFLIGIIFIYRGRR